MVLNGWKRLFLVLCVISIVPGGILWVAVKPEAASSHFVAQCADAGETLVSKRDAERMLAEFDGNVVSSAIRTDAPWKDDPIVYMPSQTQKVMWSDCATQLRRIVSGEIEDERFNEWLLGLGYGVIFYAVFLGSIYLLGWAVGWVWRGFFPRLKPEQ